MTRRLMARGMNDRLVGVRVIHADEELMIARSAGRVLRLSRARETGTPNYTFSA